MVKASWAEVTAACMWNCFCKAGFVDVVPGAEPDPFEEDQSSSNMWQCIVNSDMGGHDIGWGDLISADKDSGHCGLRNPARIRASFAEEITLTIGQAFDLAYRKFLETSGRDLEMRKQFMILQKRVQDLEDENSRLRKCLRDGDYSHGDDISSPIETTNHKPKAKAS
ncbi:hypothetical protein HPB49_020836 [Dermacentor silvarum]|uniref:Uncharacterized protein n=1 Tax=Dermacentor silvarum TaxID=543639 RepID=A0ACB8CMR0_DERSI|nr:hypothetical protein HPB49_020836 [Dermacentor silvarum]